MGRVGRACPPKRERRVHGRRRIGQVGRRAAPSMATSRPVPPNPRGDRRGSSRLSRQPSSLWYGLALLLVLGMAQAYYMAPPGRSIPYSEFKQLVKNGEIAEISIGEQAIRGTLKSGDAKTKAFTVTRVDDPKLTEEI